jgi:glutaredoxin
MASAPRPKATLYRMVMPEHLCPSGLKARWLLKRQGYEIDDHALRSRAETDAFKAEIGVQTTPQTFIGGERIGGYDDLRRFFGKPVRGKDETSYTPVLAIFAVAALLALAIGHLTGGGFAPIASFWRFVAIAMSLLAMLKLQDVERFSTMFLNYDLLARRWVPYGYAYPFLELAAGLAMLSGLLSWLAAPVALVIGGIGTVSVFKAVYIDKRALKCACVGGSGSVPLGFVSLTENLMMVAMAIWVIAGL